MFHWKHSLLCKRNELKQDMLQSSNDGVFLKIVIGADSRDQRYNPLTRNGGDQMVYAILT